MSILPQEQLERNLMKADKKIIQICSELGFSNHIKEQSYRLYKKGLEKGVIRGYNIKGMISACVFVITQLQNNSKTLDDIANAANEDKTLIEQSYKLLITELKLTI